LGRILRHADLTISLFGLFEGSNYI